MATGWGQAGEGGNDEGRAELGDAMHSERDQVVKEREEKKEEGKRQDGGPEGADHHSSTSTRGGQGCAVVDGRTSGLDQ